LLISPLEFLLTSVSFRRFEKIFFVFCLFPNFFCFVCVPNLFFVCSQSVPIKFPICFHYYFNSHHILFGYDSKGKGGPKKKHKKPCFHFEEGSIFRIICWGSAPCSKNIVGGSIRWLLLKDKRRKKLVSPSLINRSMNKYPTFIIIMVLP